MTLRYGSFGSAGAERLSLDRDEALGYLGYAGQRVDESLLARFNALADACERDTKPRFAWGVFDVDTARTDLTAAAVPDKHVALLGCNLVLPGESMAEHLAGACGVALMACTLGMENEREMRRYEALSPTDALMFSACASALVEAAANAVEARIVAWAADQGLHTNWRFSPGYGDLPLSVQPALLGVLDATRRLGMTLTPTNMIVPVKSVTAVVGLFETAQAGVGVRNICATCQLEDCCELRKRGTTCHGR